ncbi:U2-type spliceosomal complex subunit CWC22 KNAG_0K00210 [Huiozyma naganishii CBS 8797]|uniref:Pre-mRNA-splicing factor CWC22 n=1 Tax=Huiozyma naganishii (strain ATCC MYA-139 / BCRC 22969 / CBS 8797 / KCTC 17520 / NBRC 10181 / NCYC 3082 / Yp74L-3) TaxID=1071383 RepID=J7S9Z2_HUIN7|nr:hypothetical protein KNAG_0K00210 [Kazachstania naganishii CBS 8797]CCK72389.1 hypothetical protein KNAG_0K00210 [Kazachstania naganishii CBS 8797]
MDEKAQKEQWVAIGEHVQGNFQKLDNTNLIETFHNLFKVNLVIGKRLLAKAVLEDECEASVHTISQLCLLVNNVLPSFGPLIGQEIVCRFLHDYKNKNHAEGRRILKLLSSLYKVGLIHEIVILQLLQILLSRENEQDSIWDTVIILRFCGKKLQDANPRAYNAIRDKLETLECPLDSNIKTELEDLLDEKQLEDNVTLVHHSAVIVPNRYPPFSTSISQDENFWDLPKENLARFKYHQNLNDLEEEYDELKRGFSVQEPVDASEQEEIQVSETEPAPEATTVPVVKPYTVKDMTSSENIEFKKKIYLVLKSSLSGDEAAHKLLKLRIPDDRKYEIVDIVVKSSIQEATYSKFYGILGERLCSSHRSWKPAFLQIFNENFQNLDDFEPAQLRILGKFWGHMVATDYIGLEVLSNFKLNEEESTPPSRIFLKFIFQECVAELNAQELKERLQEEYIQPYLVGLFPKEDPNHIRYAINYFTAIGLGLLTDDMRETLDTIEEKKREEARIKQEEEMRRYDEERKEMEKQNPPRETPKPESRPSRYQPNSSVPAAPRRRRSITPPRYKRNGGRRSITPPRGRFRRERSRSPERFKKKSRYQG